MKGIDKSKRKRKSLYLVDILKDKTTIDENHRQNTYRNVPK